MRKRPPPLALIILDGFGEAPASAVNAISLAEPRFLMDLRQRYPSTLLDCSGERVGLPGGLMGNSEVGHLNIGAGRVVRQEITRIDGAIESGEFFEIPAFTEAARKARTGTAKLHLMGLLSDGGVHSSASHVAALLELAHREGLEQDSVLLHAFLDGRDTPPRSAEKYIADIERAMASCGVGKIVTVVGRYYAMDRDRRWDRTAKAYDALVLGEGQCARSPALAVREAYGRGENDEFVLPTVIGKPDADRVSDGDSVIFFNFRADRARQLTEAFLAAAFDGFERRACPRVQFASMIRYAAKLDCPCGFPPQFLHGIFPEIISKAGLTQLRIAETEKYAHVTFFFSGGDEKKLPGERRLLVPSPKVPTYDLAPAMSAAKVTDELLRIMAEEPVDVIVLNFANGDMVGHTGVMDATVEAVKTLDSCLARIVPMILERGGHVAITADHGNCELMFDPETGQPHTAHTTNPVPFLLAGEDLAGRSCRSSGRLCDIAPTLLSVLGLPTDPKMTGVSLL